jgi:hypothetical protein
MTSAEAWRVAAIAGVFGLALSGCAHDPDRLPRLDRQFYENLEDEKDQQAFLRLKESERQAFLEQKGLWAKWTELSSDEREAVKTRTVEVGYKEFAAHMAWGPAADVRDGESNGRVVRFETFIRCTSGPRAGQHVRQNLDCDGTSSEVQLAIENGIVTEIRHLD